ncbi:MAG: ArsA-related P-loop ATPase [Acidimicrobiales bacterium]
MEVAAFFKQSRVLIVAGKGGVGKTTVCAALAQTAAEAGLSVLIVELEGKPGIPQAFGEDGSLDYEEVLLFEDDRSGGEVFARRITPDDALLEYLADHGMKRFSRRLVSSGALDVVATAIPGIKDILVLGKVKQLERGERCDVVLVDAPATGHVMTFLSSASGLLDAARSGPLRTQAADVVELLTDPERCRVALVTLPEEMPVNEAVEAAYKLEDRVGVSLGPIVINGCIPRVSGLGADPTEAAAEVGVDLAPGLAQALSEAARFTQVRQELQEDQLRRLSDELPLRQIRVPEIDGEAIGPDELTDIAESLRLGIEELHSSNPSHPLASSRDPEDPEAQPRRVTS